MNLQPVSIQRKMPDPTRPAAVPALAGLPRIDRLPARVSLHPERAEWARLALWCDDAGLVKQQHWKGAYNAEAVVLAAMSDWATESGRFSHLGCSFSLQLAEGETDYGASWPDLLAERGLDAEKLHLAVTTWGSSNSRNFIIGGILTELESECRGLAEAALNDIREAAIRTVDVIDPARAFYLASCFYWFGEDNESIAIEEMGGEEEAGDYIVRRSQFDDYAPKWAWQPGKSLSMKALGAISNDGTFSERARRVAASCLSIRRARRKVGSCNSYAGLHEFEFIGHGAMLWWDNGDHDPMVRVLDDFEQHVMQGGEGYSESFGIDVFEASYEGFKGWLKHKKHWFDLAHKLDTLVGLVGDEVRDESN